MPTGDGQPRTFTISTETAAGAVNTDLLVDEIAADAGITTALDRIRTEGDELETFFAAALSGAETTALDALVLAHAGTSTAGSEFQHGETEDVDQNTTTADKTAHDKTAAPVVAGLFLAHWYFELRIVSPVGGAGAQVSVEIDGAEKGLTATPTDHTQWQSHKGFAPMDLAEGDTPNIVVKFRRIGGTAGTAEIRRVRTYYKLEG